MGNIALLGPNLLANGGFETGSYYPWTAAVGSMDVTDDYPVEANGVYNGWYHTPGETGLPDGNYFFQRGFTVPSSGEAYMFSGCAFETSVASLHAKLTDYATGSLWGLDAHYLLTDTDYYNYISTSFTVTKAGSASLSFTVVDSLQELVVDDLSLRRLVTLGAGYEMKQAKTLIDRQDMRSITGQIRTYISPGSFRRFEIPLTWVNSQDMASVSSWWSTAADLRLVLNDTYPQSYHNVRIVDAKQGLGQYHQAHYGSYFRGKIVLETT